MSLLDPELFERRDPFEPYDLSLDEPLKAQHKEFTTTFGYIIMSCQDQLRGRNVEELQIAVDFLNWLMPEADQRHTIASIEKMKEGKQTVYMTDPRKILTLFEDYDLEDQDAFPNATPEDYFAVLALGKCFEAIETHDRLSAYEGGKTRSVMEGVYENFPDDIQKSMYHNSIRARDSLVSEAKDLLAFIDGIRFAQLRSRNNGKRGAKAKASAFNQLNERLMAVYDEKYTSRSNRDAANRLYEEFREEIDSVLRTDAPAHRVSIWIGQHKRKIQ